MNSSRCKTTLYCAKKFLLRIERSRAAARCSFLYKHRPLAKPLVSREIARGLLQTIKPLLLVQAQLAAATAVAEANAERAEQIQAAADAAQKQFEQVDTAPAHPCCSGDF